MWLSLYNKTYFINITEATTISYGDYSEGDMLYLTVEINQGVYSIITFCFEDTEDGQINRKDFLDTIYDALRSNFNMLRIDDDKYGIVKYIL